MPVKKPNAAQVSRTLKAKANGWTVTTERGQRIDFSLNQSIGARFPVVLVTWSTYEEPSPLDGIVETLTAAGYHAEAIDVPTGSTNRVNRRAVVVRSQEDLDDQAAREERVKNAEAEAEKITPATARVTVRVTTYPDHARRTWTASRAEVLTLVTECLRLPVTDVMDADAIGTECLNDWELFKTKDRMAGMHTRVGGKRGTVLLIPVDDSGPAEVEPATPAPAEDTPAPAAEPTQGTVIPAGHTLGVVAAHADDDTARDAVAALTAAGHTPALLANDTDDDDVDLARGTGFLVDMRGPRVLVGHLIDGADMWTALPDDERRAILSGFRETMRAAGWETEGSIVGRRLYAWRTSPLPEGVTLAQTRGEKPTPVTVIMDAVKNRKDADGNGPALARFTVMPVSSSTHGVWDRTTRLWVRTAPLERCEETAKALNAGRLELDALGRVKDPQRPDDGQFEVYMREDVGYAADAARETLAEAQQCAEDGATALGLDSKGLGYQWEHRLERGGRSVWTLRSVYDWARRTGISVEGPSPITQSVGDLPRLTGHEVTIDRRPGVTVVGLRVEGSTTPLYSFDTMNEMAIPSIAGEMIRVRREVLAEQAALDALDDATFYAVNEYHRSAPVGATTVMTGAEARARLRVAREAVGPEKLHGRNTPRMTVEHSGAHWGVTLHAYTDQGLRNWSGRQYISVQPLVSAEAGRVIGQATNDGALSPVEKPGVRAFGPWVRPVLERADRVIVSRVAVGLHQRPEHEPAATTWDEWMDAYRNALETAGWNLCDKTADGWIFQSPAL
jgi:hypothetical protein